MSQRRSNRFGLLSGASTLAILACGVSLPVGVASAACVEPLIVVAGTISGSHDCALAENVEGNVTNEGTIGDPSDGDAAFVVGVGGILGTLENNGVIQGGGDPPYGERQGALTILTNVSGGILNDGRVLSGSGNALQLGSGTTDGGSYASMSGSVTNTGTISSDFGAGFAAVLGSMSGDLINRETGRIEGYWGVRIEDDFVSWVGDIDNAGVISGEDEGISIDATTFEGSILNSGQIFADTWGGTAISVEADNFVGNFTNSGLISALSGRAGVAFDGSAMSISLGEDGASQFVNSGTIEGGEIGVVLRASYANIDFSNTEDGSITGVQAGISMRGEVMPSSEFYYEPTSTFEGSIVNSGTIHGGVTGFTLEFDTIRANITNSGHIEGGVGGLFVGAQDFFGQFVNDGLIKGGTTEEEYLLQFDPGLVISAASFTGDIINNGTLEANTDALILDIGNLDGVVTNTGRITALNPGARAVWLDIGNGATFNNQDGGVIQGNVLFGGEGAAYNFIGRDGGVEGDLIGQGSYYLGEDDTITVEGGTHYFIAHGGEGAGVAAGFASFTVGAGGTAVVGSTAIGATGGNGYDLFNVDSLDVIADGHLYVDNQSELTVGRYDQSNMSTLSFYLGAPAASIATPGVDHGRIIAQTDPVQIGGTIQGIIDPLQFAGNPLTSFTYNDVLSGTGAVIGDFSTAHVNGGTPFFSLVHQIDGSTVDLTLVRNSFSSVSCSDNGTRLGELLEIIYQGGSLSPSQQALFDHLMSLPPSEICEAYDSLGGTTLADLGSVVVETAGPWKSMVNDRVNGMGSVGCSLAGSGSCFNRFAANEYGATQTMTDASGGADPFDWLRTGTRRVGETATWGRLIGVWGSTDGAAGVGGTEYQLTGGIIGVDHVFGPNLLAGAAMQYTVDNVSFDDSPFSDADINSFEIGAYASLGDTRLYLNANASLIWHNFDVQRFLADGYTFADYSGTTVSGFAEVGKIFEIDQWRLQPLAALSFAHLETDAYAEQGTSLFRLQVEGADHTSLKSLLGLRVARPYELESGRKIVPEARAVWVHEFMDDHSSFQARFVGDPPASKFLVRGQDYSRESVVLGAGLTAPLSDNAMVVLDYDAGLNPDMTSHTISGGFRLKW